MTAVGVPMRMRPSPTAGSLLFYPLPAKPPGG
ncbi:MAG: hypothetical protein QOJ07_3440 [Thermoleophilaceae bacterium]|nr:hypothetical protein [Thermoleophilaceae bacterium]